METFIEFLIGLAFVVGLIGIPWLIGYSIKRLSGHKTHKDNIDLCFTGLGVIIMVGLVCVLMIPIGKVLHLCLQSFEF